MRGYWLLLLRLGTVIGGNTCDLSSVSMKDKGPQAFGVYPVTFTKFSLWIFRWLLNGTNSSTGDWKSRWGSKAPLTQLWLTLLLGVQLRSVEAFPSDNDSWFCTPINMKPRMLLHRLPWLMISSSCSSQPADQLELQYLAISSVLVL